MLVELFCDKWHKGVDNLHQLLEDIQRGLQRSGIYGSLISRLNHLEIPAREFIGEQFEGCHQCLVEAILAIEVVDFCYCCTNGSLHPCNSLLVGLRLCNICLFPSLNQAEGIPYFVAESSSLLTEVLLEENIVACRSSKQHTHANTICSILLDKAYGIGAIAETLGHLTTNLIAYNTCEIYAAEGNILQVFFACHNHTGNPEENNIRTGYKDAGGVVVVNLFVARIVDAIEQRYGPQPTGEPCVQCILILREHIHSDILAVLSLSLL